MSALCQKRTLRTILDASETIVVFSSIGAAGRCRNDAVKLVDASETIRACQRPYNVSLPD